MRTWFIAGLVGLLLSGPAHAQWVNDWFATSSSTPSGWYEGQQRGYYTGGSFQGRWRMSNDYLVSAQLPRLKVGCGGIDVFGGGFSYMDPEFLVQKFERIIQAAPAFAFQLALSHLSKDVSAKMAELESIADQLNSIQVNDCRLSKGIAAVITPGHTKEGIDALKTETASIRSLGGSIRKNWKAFGDASDNAGGGTPDDVKPLLNGCPAIFKEVFGGGSVVANAARLVGLDGYAGLMRAMVGDAVVSPVGTTFVVRKMNGCPERADRGEQDPLQGQLMTMDDSGRCTLAGEARVDEVIGNRLRGIVTRIRAGQPLTPDDRAFIDQSPLPVKVSLTAALQTGTADVMVRLLTGPLSTAYAHQIMDDLYKASEIVLSKAEEIESNAASAPAPEPCETTIVRDGIDHIRSLNDRVLVARDRLHVAYQKRLNEFVTNVQAGRDLKEIEQRGLSAVAQTVKR